jgi:hypothetical protein
MSILTEYKLTDKIQNNSTRTKKYWYGSKNRMGSNISIFWDVTPFAGIQITFRRNITSIFTLAFCLVYLINSQDGDDMFLQNDGNLSTDYMTLYLT